MYPCSTVPCSLLRFRGGVSGLQDWLMVTFHSSSNLRARLSLQASKEAVGLLNGLWGQGVGVDQGRFGHGWRLLVFGSIAVQYSVNFCTTIHKYFCDYRSSFHCGGRGSIPVCSMFIECWVIYARGVWTTWALLAVCEYVFMIILERLGIYAVKSGNVIKGRIWYDCLKKEVGKYIFSAVIVNSLLVCWCLL
jgi:hypothetical protein